MSSFKKKLLIAAGYLGFFLVCLAVFLVMTFDARIIFQMVQKQAALQNLRLEARDVDLHHLVGLDVKGLRLTFPGGPGDDEGRTVLIDRLVISPSLSSLIGAASALMKNRVPPIAFSFEARIGGGSVKGEVAQKPPSLELSDIEISALPLERLPLSPPSLENFQASGAVTGGIGKLELGNMSQPNTWQGDIQFDIAKPAVTDFKWNGMIDLPGITMDSATFKAEIKDGEAEVKTLKLVGKDLPTNLQGTVSLKAPIGRSVLNLKGPLQAGEEYKAKSAIIAGYLPASGNVLIKGTLDMPVMTAE